MPGQCATFRAHSARLSQGKIPTKVRRSRQQPRGGNRLGHISGTAESAGSLPNTEDANPPSINPAVAEALEKVAEAMLTAEETVQRVHTLPSARLPNMASSIYKSRVACYSEHQGIGQRMMSQHSLN